MDTGFWQCMFWEPRWAYVLERASVSAISKGLLKIRSLSF